MACGSRKSTVSCVDVVQSDHAEIATVEQAQLITAVFFGALPDDDVELTHGDPPSRGSGRRDGDCDHLRVLEALDGPLVHLERADRQRLVCLGLLIVFLVSLDLFKVTLSGSIASHFPRRGRKRSLPSAGAGS